MAEPSKVIHVRNVGHEISENDLLQLFQPFGVITKLVMLRAKNQALLQMQDIPSAVNALQFYANVQPSIRGRNVYVQFSSHQELTTMDQNQAREDEFSFSLSRTSLFILLSLSLFSFSMLSAVGNSLDAQPNRILLVTVHHMLYPITADVLHQVFSPHGFVEKIVTFQKSAGFQALIQYQSRQSAVTARSTLQGRNIYDGCCQLDIQFSNLDELQVNYNNDRSRDFTNPNLPTEQKGRSSQPGYGDAAGMYSGARAGAKNFNFLWWVLSGGCFSSQVEASFAIIDTHLGFHLVVKDNHYIINMANAAAIAAAFGGGLPPGITGTNERCTVLVANLNPDRIDEDKLFNLFSIYGNIVRIKLLRNKPDHALIQMGDGFQAELAVHFLKGAMLFGKRLEVNYSKHANITQGADTHEYVNSNLNRFNRNAAKNYRYCCSPTKMVHLSTLPQDITEEEVVSLLEEHGTIVNSKVFEMNGKKQALVQFETEEQATEALVCKHASPLSGSVVRISFSQLQNI
ncbi:Polypyrimidine tract-binding 3 [Glycine max]|nr:Polypyrimidine tract-binding 3 [Glycine max]KAH1206774.1 Polypyrimidine tract-binding 3 [Glycine max]